MSTGEISRQADRDVVRVRLREGDGFTALRYSRGPVLHGSREPAPHQLLRLLAGDDFSATEQIAGGRAAVGREATLGPTLAPVSDRDAH